MYDYDLADLISSPVFIIAVIIQVVYWVVFFVMAWNVGKIKNILKNEDFKFMLEKAKRYDYTGNKQKAIELYLEFIYSVENKEWDEDYKKNILDKVKARVKALGGEVPENPTIIL